MDCKNARLVLTVAHPLATELGTQDKAELACHLADCPDCGPWAEGECVLDEYLGKAIRAVEVPAGLGLRIERRLYAERDAWFRGWTVRAAGVAAALFLTVWAGWALWLNQRPAPDLPALLHQFDVVLASPEQVEEYFSFYKRVSMTAPPQFEYNYLRSAEMTAFQGHQVPRLFFSVPGNNPPLEGWVYVLSNKQFNLEQAQKLVPSPGSKMSMEALPHPTHPNVLYIVVFPAGTRLDAFFKAGQKGMGHAL